MNCGGYSDTVPASETLIVSVRVEPVETRSSGIKGFDRLSPNGRYLLSVSLPQLAGTSRLALESTPTRSNS